MYMYVNMEVSTYVHMYIRTYICMYVRSSILELTYIHDLLVAVEAVSVTCMVILTDDGLLSTSTGCTC